MLQNEVECQPDTLELIDDTPIKILRPRVKDTYKEGVPHFYVSLNAHDMILHNAMLDPGASHNLMPRVVVEILGLDM